MERQIPDSLVEVARPAQNQWKRLMPFAPHQHFAPPKDPNATIWRYMDLAKLISLLEHSALFFPRVTTLSAADPFEGYYTNVYARFLKLTFDTAPEELKKAWNVSDRRTFDVFMQAYRKMGEDSKVMRELTFVSSWHVLEHESAAMWALYLRSEDGIAVRSTYQRLIDSLAPSKEFPIHVGLIRYIDFETEAIPPGQVMFPMMHKRKSFEHEHELRALIWLPEIEARTNPNLFLDPTTSAYHGLPGLYAPTDLEQLVDRIFVAPSAPKWFVEVVEGLVARYGFRKQVVYSQLAASPLY